MLSPLPLPMQRREVAALPSVTTPPSLRVASLSLALPSTASNRSCPAPAAVDEVDSGGVPIGVDDARCCCCIGTSCEWWNCWDGDEKEKSSFGRLRTPRRSPQPPASAQRSAPLPQVATAASARRGPPRRSPQPSASARHSAPPPLVATAASARCGPPRRSPQPPASAWRSAPPLLVATAASARRCLSPRRRPPRCSLKPVPHARRRNIRGKSSRRRKVYV